MAEVAKLSRRQVVEQEIIDQIRECLCAAERGEVVELSFVANDATGGTYFRASDFQDGWRMIGALEYAKAGVLKGFTEG